MSKMLLSSCRLSRLLLPLVALFVASPLSASPAKSSPSLEVQLRGAIQNRQPQKAVELLRRGANPNAQKGTLFQWAISTGNQSLVREFVARGARITPDALKIALQRGGDGVAAMTLFLNRGADPNTVVSYQNYEDEGDKIGPPTPHTLLMVAAEEGKLAAAKLLVARGARVNTRLSTGLTALRVAARSSSFFDEGNPLDFCRYLLDKGAQVTGAESGLLQLIVDHNDLALFDHLKKRGALPIPLIWPYSLSHLSLALAQKFVVAGANPNGNASRFPMSPLESACYDKNLPLARFLLDRGARISADILEISIPDRLPSREEQKQWEEDSADDEFAPPEDKPNFSAAEDDRLLQLFLEHDAGYHHDSPSRVHADEMPLHKAAANNRVGAIRLLLTHGANIEERDFKGNTPLVQALESRSDMAVPALLEAGASIASRDNDDNTPLFHLLNNNEGFVSYSSLAVIDSPDAPDSRAPEPTAPEPSASDLALPYVQQLVAHGADVRAQNKAGNTPLHLAAANGMISVVQFLLEHSAQLEAPNNSGRTPLASACAAGQFATAEFLFERGANPDAPDATGKTPRQLANEPFTMKMEVQGKDKISPQEQKEMEQFTRSYSLPVQEGRRRIAALFARAKTSP